MVLIFLVLIPLLTAIMALISKGAAKSVSLAGSLVTLAISAYVTSACFSIELPSWSMPWIPALGAQLSFYADGMAAMLCLLTAIVFPVVLLVNWNKEIDNAASYYGLIMLSQAGLMGVFLASDVLLFYVFWELALIPVYFLCSRWGAERRIPVTFKFFVYTFVGSLMMLSALIFISMHNPGPNAMSWSNIIAAGKNLPFYQQQWVFWLLFIAFAIKMPIFPFHTWQPDAYEQSPTPVTIILSALMVKMGLFATMRWLIPVLPDATAYWSDTVIILSIIGIVYASCIAIVQTDVKRLIAYSSIAHMGLMCAAAFAGSNEATHGLMVQMFNHGINIAGMWVIVAMVENRYGTRDMSKLGGIATAAPGIAIALVIIAFANIALPLTNGFVGEFMLFNGIFQGASQYHIWYMVIAGTGVILGAVYTLTMVQKVAFGEKGALVSDSKMTGTEYAAVAIIIALILILGFYPAPLLELTSIR